MFSNRRRRFGIESLETRTMMAADLLNGTLTIVGTNANDNIQVEVAVAGPHTGELQVDINGTQSFFTVAQVTSISIDGLKGNDTITVDDNVVIATTIHGGKGNDTIKGGGGTDTIYGEWGNDTIDGSLGNDTIDGGVGNDTIHGGAGDDHLAGGNGNDTLWGDEDNDFADGGNGNDTVDGEEGNDTCRGGNGKDTLRGGDDNDSLYGDNGKDTVWGGEGDDYMDGGNGSDDCRGENGDDEMKGGRGRDRVDGGGGSNLYDDDDQDDSSNGIPCDLDNQFRALLVGPNNASGHAEYESENENGVLRTKLELEVQDLAANSTFDLIIGGVTVGQITTDGSGQAEVRFSSLPHGNEVAFPGNFPQLQDGTTIAVGAVLTGTFATHLSHA